MSDTPTITAPPPGVWFNYPQGLDSYEVTVLQVKILSVPAGLVRRDRAGMQVSHILELIRGEVTVFKTDLTAAAAAHLAKLLQPPPA